MRTTIYAVYRKYGEEVKRVELGNVNLDNGRISARRYDELKRKVLKFGREKQAYWSLETKEGLKDTFGGYPATDSKIFVLFE